MTPAEFDIGMSQIEDARGFPFVNTLREQLWAYYKSEDGTVWYKACALLTGRGQRPIEFKDFVEKVVAIKRDNRAKEEKGRSLGELGKAITDKLKGGE